jgi:dienelactone hydrolase
MIAPMSPSRFRSITNALAVLAAAMGLDAAAGQPRTVEEVVTLPFPVPGADGRMAPHPMTVTIFRDDRRQRSPFLVLNHGRAARSDEREKLGRARFSDNSRYFVALGYAVFVPTRIGYGVTGGRDLENSGPCATKHYRPIYEAAADQIVAVIDYAKAQSYIDPARGIVVGQSFGGTTAIAVAARGVPGVAAAVNFAGGGGGRPHTHPENPCRDDLVRDLFAAYASTARIPTLWVYSENDKYWGARLPRVWFDRFLAAGGQGRFVWLPPHKSDGHPSFAGNPAAWRPAFEAFVRGE